jgi:hypothetical protein
MDARVTSAEGERLHADAAAERGSPMVCDAEADAERVQEETRQAERAHDEMQLAAGEAGRTRVPTEREARVTEMWLGCNGVLAAETKGRLKKLAAHMGVDVADAHDRAARVAALRRALAPGGVLHARDATALNHALNLVHAKCLRSRQARDWVWASDGEGGSRLVAADAGMRSRRELDADSSTDGSQEESDDSVSSVGSCNELHSFSRGDLLRIAARHAVDLRGAATQRELVRRLHEFMVEGGNLEGDEFGFWLDT